MNKYSLFIVVLFVSIYSYSQNLDSLLQVARSTKNDSIKYALYSKVGFQYIFNNVKKANSVIQEGKLLAEKSNHSYGLAELTNIHGIYMDVTGKSDSARYYFTKALNISRENNLKGVESKCINNLGMYNWNKGNYNEALDYFFESLKMDQISNNRELSAIRLNNIGLIYQEMNLIDKALEYHEKAYKIRQEFNLKKEQVVSLNNIGICYKELGKLDDAIETYLKGIDLAKESNNLLNYYHILDNLGNAYQLKGEYKKAIETHKKGLNKPEEFKVDRRSELISYSNLIALYNQINKPKEALIYIQRGLKTLDSNPQLENIAGDLYLNAAESNYMLDDYGKARIFRDKFIDIKNSIFSETNAKTLADLEVKYETEKKEKEILVQRAEIAEKDLKIQKRGFQIVGLVGIALLVGAFGFFFFKQQKLKNIQIKKENELKVALTKIEHQNMLQEQRLRISRDLHDNIGAQLTFIISSLDNLKYGFNLPDKLNNKLNEIGEFTSDTIFELRDTIWAMNKTEISLDDLQSRISNFIEKANLSFKDQKFEFNVSEEISKNVRFTSIQGINVYRIIQESLNNAVKYANASKISVDINSKDNNIQIIIADNGVGFNKNEIEPGNGLNNINKRALDLKADLKIISEIDNGTQIILKIPTNV